ncbi:MAG: tail fiber domain-containing protein [Erysipelotrichia bacterium]|nr:tail fiber domain-containing protein [Erysipelotrichia bacterium]
MPDAPADGNSAINKNFIDGGSSNLVHKTGDETVGGAKTFTSQVKAPSFNASSSRKVKENISDSEDKALDIIKKTKIVRYSYIDDPDSYSHIGFIAEDTVANSKPMTKEELAAEIGL